VFVLEKHEDFLLEIPNQASFNSKVAIESRIMTMANIVEFHDIHNIFTLSEAA
jgi:hypothetical protein